MALNWTYEAVPDTDPELDVLRNNYARNRDWSQRLPTYSTRLSPAMEQEFQAWIWKNKVPFNLKWPPDQSMQDYDMRGFWKALSAGDPVAAQSSETQHFPDRWKTPYHHSFSAESVYATPDAPRWVGNKLMDKAGNVLVDEMAK